MTCVGKVFIETLRIQKASLELSGKFLENYVYLIKMKYCANFNLPSNKNI